MTPNWRAVVYGAERERFTISDDWAKTRRKVIRRDHQMCQRCLRHLRYADATAHHIKPRSEGGGDDLGNLMTLCSSCHDFVEIADPPLRSSAAIAGSYTTLRVKHVDEVRSPDWHAWVYGGARPPY